MRKLKLKVCVLSGDEAKAAFNQGIRDPQSLQALGFYQEFPFNTPAEQAAFIAGFELWEHLEEPILWPLTTTRTEGG